MGGPRKNPHPFRAANPSIRDVAERAGVSVATVSRVVNGVPTVGSELVEHVQTVIRELGYVPNIQARALVSGRSRMLGLVVSEITNPFFPQLVQDFENLSLAQGYEIFIGSTNNEVARTEAVIRRMLQRGVDGAAVMTFGIDEKVIAKLVTRGFPLVFVDVGPTLPNTRVLKIDYGKGIGEAVKHFADLGHRQIAFVSGPLQMPTAVARRDAFLQAMSEVPLPVPPEFLVEGTHTMEGGIAAAESLFAVAEVPTAILCSNDITAIGVIHGLHQGGRGVPLDVSVVGFDDIQLAQFILPPLTTVQMSSKELATAAVDALQAGIEPAHPRAQQKDWPVSTRLIVRQSTSSPRASMARHSKIKRAARSGIKS